MIGFKNYLSNGLALDLFKNKIFSINGKDHIMVLI